MNETPDISSWFWDVIASSDSSLRLLCRQLEQMSKEQMLQYQSEYETAKSYLDPYADDRLWKFISKESQFSEDGADDFSSWVVTQGREYFELVRSHPEDLQNYIDLFNNEVDGHFGRSPLRWDEEVDKEIYRGYQRAASIAFPIYRDRFGEELQKALDDLP